MSRVVILFDDRSQKEFETEQPYSLIKEAFLKGEYDQVDGFKANTIKYFGWVGGSRYAFDFKYCKLEDGWIQLDTKQDASYFGNWVNLSTREIWSFTEGDVCFIAKRQELGIVQEIKRAMRFYFELGYDTWLDPYTRKEEVLSLLAKYGKEGLLSRSRLTRMEAAECDMKQVRQAWGAVCHD